LTACHDDAVSPIEPCTGPDALKRELLQHAVLRADETPVAMLEPGNGKTHRAAAPSAEGSR
jgi:hypothetical protein